MIVNFQKYQGTGNDFILIDNRKWNYNSLTKEQIRFMCDRHFGIGADGLMLLNHKEGYDFEMKYYNSDGREGSMCGNGGRCMVKFAHDLGIHRKTYNFLATDGPHEAEMDDTGIISLKMSDVPEIREVHGDFVLNTGSPHYVKIVADVMDRDVFAEGTNIRYSPPYSREGINVNFVERKDEDAIFVRTYERGVEDETLSCGTGVTAAALVSYHNDLGFNEVMVETRGGRLSVRFDRTADHKFENIWLCGPAEKSFEGKIDLDPLRTGKWKSQPQSGHRIAH